MLEVDCNEFTLKEKKRRYSCNSLSSTIHDVQLTIEVASDANTYPKKRFINCADSVLSSIHSDQRFTAITAIVAIKAIYSYPQRPTAIHSDPTTVIGRQLYGLQAPLNQP